MTRDERPVATTRERAAVGLVLVASAAWIAGARGLPLLPFAMGAAGLLALHDRLRREHAAVPAALTIVALFAGTSLFWSMTHSASARDAALFALVAAAMCVLPRMSGAGRVAAWASLAVVPLALSIASDSFDGASTSPLARLFGSPAGLLSTGPLAYIATLGAIVCAVRRPDDNAGLLAASALWVVLPVANSATDAGPAAHGLTPALALLAPGLTWVITVITARPLAGVTMVALLFVLWNYWLMVQYTVGLLPKDAPVSFAAMVRQQADVPTRAPYVHPLAAPANLWFAWRTGLPADRFETLAFESLPATLDLSMGRPALQWLLDGWEAPGPDAREPAQWIRERRATLALPVLFDPARDADVMVTARARLEEPAVTATIALELNDTEIGRFVVPPDQPTTFTARLPSGHVGRLARPGYNRLTFVSYDVARVDPADTRPPGPLASRPGNRAWPVAIYRISVAPR